MRHVESPTLKAVPACHPARLVLATPAQPSSGPATGAYFDQLDGVRVYDAAGKAIDHIRLPERCANLCFGGAKNSRLFMAASHSLFAPYMNTTGAV